jgi:Fur family iron response transcriptional regulator
MRELIDTLLERDIRPSAQRLEVARFVLDNETHPTAEDALVAVRRRLPTVSAATIYNTLNLFVERGLLQRLILPDGVAAYDPNTEPHHHLVDIETHQVRDLPWEAICVHGIEDIEGFEVRDHRVVIRGQFIPRKPQ